jgi:hypothetical protein
MSSRRITIARRGSIKRGNRLEFASVRLLQTPDGIGVEGAVIRKLAQRASGSRPVPKLKQFTPIGYALKEGVEAGTLRRTGPFRALLKDRVGITLGRWSVSDGGLADALEPQFAELSSGSLPRSIICMSCWSGVVPRRSIPRVDGC